MGAYKYWNPATQKYEIIKSKSIVKEDGSLEYTPDDIKAIDNKIDILTALPTATGVANTYSVNIGGLSALTTGLKVTVKFNLANTGASTLNINGLGAKSIAKAGGATLTSGNIKVNGVYSLVYDGTSFQLQGEGGEYGTALAGDVLQGKTIGTDDGLVSGTIPSKSAQTYTPGTSNQTIASGRYLSGTQTISGSSNLKAINIKKGINMFGVNGTLNPALGEVWVSSTVDTELSGYKIGPICRGNGMWVLSASSAAAEQNRFYSSPDGITWTQRTTPLSKYGALRIVYGNKLFVASGMGTNSDGILATSPDGITWTQRSPNLVYSHFNVYGLTHNNNLWVGSSTNGSYTTSTDGISWSGGLLGTSAYHKNLMSVCFGDGMWVQAGDSGDIWTSTNGTSWTMRTLPTTKLIKDMKYGDGLFVGVGSNGTVITSPDGINWTLRNISGSTSSLDTICFENGLWLALEQTGKLFSSTNGIDWSLKTTISGVSSGGEGFIGSGAGYIVGNYDGRIQRSFH